VFGPPVISNILIDNLDIHFDVETSDF
jgi:hypothetical protein